MPWEVVRRTIAADLGVPLEQAFASIDPVPLATASVAQVHAAGAPAASSPVGRGLVVRPEPPRCVTLECKSRMAGPPALPARGSACTMRLQRV